MVVEVSIKKLSNKNNSDLRLCMPDLDKLDVVKKANEVGLPGPLGIDKPEQICSTLTGSLQEPAAVKAVGKNIFWSKVRPIK
ncbi:hypothetical protein DSUL_40091 [Desulfovibrionales bacterium]